MLNKTEAIVLHSVKYGDQRLIVDMFTRDFGVMAFAVALPKTRGRMGKHLFQPLTMLSVEADTKPSQQIQRLRDASIRQPLPSLQTEPSKLAIAMFLSEFLYHALRNEQVNEPLYNYICASLEWLEERQGNLANFHLVFLMHLARFLGFHPNIDTDGSYFDLRAATFCVQPPLHRDILLPDEALHIRTLMRMNYATMHLFRLSRQERQRIVEVITLFYRLHLPQFPELHSPAILATLFI